MPTSLVRGRYVICRVTGPTEAVVVEDGAVFQQDGEIVEVGSYAELAAKHAPDEVLGSADHVVLPGLVNGHHHVGLTPFQLGSPDHPLELWFASRAAARDVDPYLDTLYSAFEMVESGVTTVQHLHGLRRGPVSMAPMRARQVLRAYGDVGMRVSYALMARDQNRLVYGPDEEFVGTLPPALGRDVGEWLAGTRLPWDAFTAMCDELWATTGRNAAERVRIWLAPGNLHWCSDELLVKLREYAHRLRAGLHIHLLETVYQKLYARRRARVSAVQHLADLGFLGPDVTLGHAVWVTEADLDLLAETGTAVCTNGSSNLRLQSGIAPVPHFLARGLRVAIGIDEAGINDDRDMLQEMRVVLKLHRPAGHDDPVPTAGQVLRMATEHGAHATGFGPRIGAIEPGRAADLVLVRLSGLAEPYLDRDVPIVDAVVHRAKSAHVETVIIAGEVVLRDRRFTRVDKDAALRELGGVLAAPLRPEELRRRELARDLFPHVRRFYADWTPEAGEPWNLRNQRR